MDHELIQKAIADENTFCREMMSLWYEAKKKEESVIIATPKQFVDFVRELDEREIIYRDGGVRYRGMTVKIG